MQPINVVALGVYRHVAATMEKPFQHTPYRMAAIVDLKSSPEAFTYSAHNLGAVLYTLHPPPQVFITGAAISQSMADESIGVWKEYIKNTGTKDTLLINLQGEPPADGNWMLEIMGKLDGKYKNNRNEL
ncbi:hypothetical protein N431DRAFT_441182 [Stipitochalara longipes BDJ]|nr:hypothetical protein N431DRAFT_441182 [Stipitochalara longipes BDJ]